MARSTHVRSAWHVFLSSNHYCGLVCTRSGEPPTLQKTLPWPSPHMFAVLGMVFCPQIIIDGWSTLSLVSPNTLPKTLPRSSPHLFAVLGMGFCPQIIIDRWSTLALMSHPPKNTTMVQSTHVRSAWHGFLSSNHYYWMVYTRLGEPHTVKKISMGAQSTHVRSAWPCFLSSNHY